jgi:hypothetical protein
MLGSYRKATQLVASRLVLSSIELVQLEGLLSPRPIPIVEHHPLHYSRDWLLNTVPSILDIWKLLPQFAFWGRIVPWWQGLHIAPQTTMYRTVPWGGGGGYAVA